MGLVVIGEDTRYLTLSFILFYLLFPCCPSQFFFFSIFEGGGERAPSGGGFSVGKLYRIPKEGVGGKLGGSLGTVRRPCIQLAFISLCAVGTFVLKRRREVRREI